jgi:hypothetical protein
MVYDLKGKLVQRAAAKGKAINLRRNFAKGLRGKKLNKAGRRILVEVQGATAAGIAKNSYVPRIAT